MPFRLALQIALRHLGSRKRQTLLATLGVVVGGAIFALMLAITIGQQEFLEERLIDVSPHLTVTSDRTEPVTSQNLVGELEKNAVVELHVNVPPSSRRELKPFSELVARVENLKPDVTAVAPYVTLQGVFRHGMRYETVTVRGIIPEREKKIARLAENIREGKLEDVARTQDGAAIGSGLAKKLGVGIGDNFSFVTPSGTIQNLRVAAIFQSGVASIDDRQGYIDLELAQSLRGMPRNSVTGLSVQTADIDRVGEIKRIVQTTTGYKTETWQESNAQILEFQARQRITSQILVIFVFITAAFGISNTLAAIVLQKKADIAAMKSFGISRRDVMLTFILEGAVIGILGGILAAVAGYGLARLFAGLDLVPKGNERAYVRFDHFPVALDYGIFLFTFALSVVMAVVASALPARRAARFLPVRIMREN
jgi:lipoprotein-releasing system permease protein